MLDRPPRKWPLENFIWKLNSFLLTRSTAFPHWSVKSACIGWTPERPGALSMEPWEAQGPQPGPSSSHWHAPACRPPAGRPPAGRHPVRFRLRDRHNFEPDTRTSQKCSKHPSIKDVPNPSCIISLPCHPCLLLTFPRFLTLNILKGLTFPDVMHDRGPSIPQTPTILPRLNVGVLTDTCYLTPAIWPSPMPMSLLFPSRN